ncbi:MAG TPA: PEP-utilizing enzyme [Ilumatobacteraceae bacterium]|nr:PEP-utilizing enzyme [Ilumatobacteraceae bacterium]
MYYVTDTALSARFPIYTRANVGEVFPDPVTPLTSDTALWLAELGWRDAWARMGAFDLDEFPSDEFCQLGVLGGYCYLNASLVRVFGERAPGLSWRAMDEQFFGVQPGIPDYEPHPGDPRPDLTTKLGETFSWVFGQTTLSDLARLTDHRTLTIELRARRPDLTSMSERQLWERFEHLLPVHRELFAEHIFTSYMASVPAGVISTIADAVGRPDLVLAVLGGIGEVDSAAPSHALWALSRLNQRSDDFADGFARFLFDFGSRGPNEWEARSPTWETRPALAIAAIDRMRAAPDAAAPDIQFEVCASQRQQATHELLGLVAGNVEAQGNLEAAIGCSTAWLPGRERTKTNCIRLIHEMRVSMREIGRRMVERGVFDEIEDFGFVRAAETDVLLEGDASTLTPLIRERRAQYHGLQARVPPFVFVGSAAGPDTWPERGAATAEHLDVGDELRGLPGCPGVAEGRACIILDPNDPFALEPGDVLVAPITDPSWTPLFVPAAAVVVDVGAALSHAIIVSRELGIPCVVSATDATRRIPDGAWIRVDGGAGVVTVLED